MEEFSESTLLGQAAVYLNTLVVTGNSHGGPFNDTFREEPTDPLTRIYWRHDTSPDYESGRAYAAPGLPADFQLVHEADQLLKEHAAGMVQLSPMQAQRLTMARDYFADKYMHGAATAGTRAFMRFVGIGHLSGSERPDGTPQSVYEILTQQRGRLAYLLQTGYIRNLHSVKTQRQLLKGSNSRIMGRIRRSRRRRRAPKPTSSGEVVRYAALGSIPAGLKGFTLAKTKRVTHTSTWLGRLGVSGTAVNLPGEGKPCRVSFALSNLKRLGGKVVQFDASGNAQAITYHTDFQQQEPYGFDTMQSLYQYYTVIGATIRVTRIPTKTEAASTGMIPCYVFGTLSTESQPDPLFDKDDEHFRLFEKNKIAGWTLVRGGASQMDTIAMVWRAEPKSLFNVKNNVAGLEPWRGNTANLEKPTASMMFTLYEMPANQGQKNGTIETQGPIPPVGHIDVGTYTYQVSIDYDVVYSEPLVLTKSAV